MNFNIFKKKKKKKKSSYLENNGQLLISRTIVPPSFAADEPNHIPRWESNLFVNKIYLK